MKSRTAFLVAVSAALGMSMLACSQQQQAGHADMAATTAQEVAAPAASASAEATADVAAAPDSPQAAQLTSSAATYSDARRKFIRTAQAKFRVKDVYAAALAIEDAVAAQGGFVTRNEIGTSINRTTRQSIGGGKLVELAEYTVNGQLTVRVPSDKAQVFLRSIVQYMEFLDNRNFAATDAQFDLLRQQLAYQRNQEAQVELGAATAEGGKLDQKAAVIAARSDARSSRDEALIAQKQFEDRVEFATLDLSLYQLPKLRRTEMTDLDAAVRKEGPGFFSRLWDSLRGGWFGLLEAGLVFARLWPLWLALALGLLVVQRLRRRRG